MKVFIAGLGLIGGSYAEGLTKAGHEVYGYDPHEKTIDYALKHHFILKAGLEYIKDSDMIILGFYPTENVAFIKEHSHRLQNNQIITDVSGIKKDMTRSIEEILPKGVKYCSHHPMAGREKRGIENASSLMFKNANFIITPTKHSSEDAILAIRKMANDLGFKRVSIITPEEHDELIGYTSQLPHAMAVALVNSNTHEKTESFTGDSYRDLTRIAVINELLWSELFFENKDNLLQAINVFEQELDKIKEAISNNDREALKSLFIKSTQRRREFK